MQDVYKRSLQAAKKGKVLTFHWRGGYLTREVLNELITLIRKAGTEKNKSAVISINWPQAVLRLHYTDIQIQESVTMEDANEGEQEDQEILAEAPQEQEDQSTIQYPPELFADKRILLAEDNSLNREIAIAILEGVGLKTDIAENGAIAVEKIAVSPSGYYDAVLMDIQMSVMDGYTATRQIRALPNKFHSRIPVIAVSANAFDEDMEASYEAGMNGHLAKPIIESELLKTLGEIWFNN